MSRKALAKIISVMKLDITCKKAVDLISKKEEGKLSALQRVQLWNHLVVCSLCRNFSKQGTWLRSLYKTNTAHELTADEKEQMINAAMRQSGPDSE